MKSEYRQAVEAVIAQEAKLAEVANLHAEALAQVEKTTEWVALNEKTLKEYVGRVEQIESLLLIKS
ncbi:hypothetical protein [Pseudomonas proteolytica]|jgi:hypothetical protein|uniref:hypothetical protein n=1 Tax=Pseudomonas proteolytica TaxID=219574 RepID=UPI0030DD75B3